MKKLFIILLFFSFKLFAQFSTPINMDIEALGKGLFTPVIITTKNDSIIKGYGHQYGGLSILFVKEIPKDKNILKPSDWKSYYINDLKRVVFPDFYGMHIEKYTVRLKGSLTGFKSLLYKLYENASVTVYANFAVPEVGKQQVSEYYIKLFNDKSAYRLLILFDKAEKPMSKKVFKKFGKCAAIEREKKSGNYKQTYEDFIKLVDLYHEKCSGL